MPHFSARNDKFLRLMTSRSLSRHFSNANNEEVLKFSSFASHWWDSTTNPLVTMNPIRVQFLTSVVQEFQKDDRQNFPTFQLALENKRALDIGCGGGLLTESLARLGASFVVGIDASQEVVDVAEMHSKQEFHDLASTTNGNNIHRHTKRKLQYIGGVTVEKLADTWQLERKQKQAQADGNENNELFDIVTALEIIEHVPNPSSLLRSAITLLKPNGLLVVSSINRTAKSYGLAILAAEYIMRKVPLGTHDWNRFMSPQEVEAIICGYDQSMKQVSLSGMVLSPPFFNMRWSLDPRDTNVNWIAAYQKCTNSKLC